ncbi:MAG TPA: winged helix-turn-helix domain-containing protein [Vicinamibacterales bacterium]|jgi:TolB-like protein/DNA-binding winged helix-turn-helix (wHTH) protein/Flp pilus assembly protein TadD|nr:winged helix-turn-helix domain-containing protein [Vicinamibacterales bacterium]
MTPDSRETFRFGDFVLDLAAYELRDNGRAVRLERQPMDLLILLVERRGQLVTRADIVERLWGPDIFVDVETGVHTAIRKIRRALRDSPDVPTFLDTVPGKGYRFIAPVSVEGPGTAAPVPELALAEVPAREAVPPRSVSSSRALFATIALMLAVLAGLSGWAWHRAELTPSEVTLAVLPFEDLSGDPEAEYLASGLAEEVIVALGQIDPAYVHVVGRTSIMTYKHTTKSRAEIGRELHADYLVESAVRSERGRVRITAGLVRVRDQIQVWSDSYDREPTSILSLQQELSAAIATQIRLRLSPDRLSALGRRQTHEPEAYDLYLRGRNFANQRTPATTNRAIEYFQRATTLDPNYALAWAELARVYSSSTLNADAPPLTVGPLARNAAMQAVRADRNLAEAQEALGHSLWTFSWNWPAAEQALRRAVALGPQSVMSHTALGHLLSQMGRHIEAEAFMRRARELDPLFAMSHAMSSQVAYQARDYASAVEYGRQAVTIDPDFWIGHITLGQAYQGLGRTADALEELTTAARLSGQNSKALSLRGYLLAKAGRANEARDLLRTLEAASHQRYVPPYAFALVQAGLGERDAVFASLDNAFAVHDVHLMYLPVDPKWDPYRDDPRFKALVDKCGFMRTQSR